MVLGGEAISYERAAPVPSTPFGECGPAAPPTAAECWPPPQDVRLREGLPSSDLLGSRTDADREVGGIDDLLGGGTLADRGLVPLEPAPSPAVLMTRSGGHPRDI